MTIDYGEDFAGGADIDASLTVVGGNRALLYAIARRLMTPRGAYPPDQEYGTDIRAQVGSTVRSETIGALVEAEVSKDERVLGVTATVTRDRLDAHSSEKLKIEIDIIGARGPFQATLLVSELTVDILNEIGG